MTGNESAFPNQVEATHLPDTFKQVMSGGLTKREMFAAMCMQGQAELINAPLFNAEIIAKNSILMADALLKELEKGNQK